MNNEVEDVFDEVGEEENGDEVFCGRGYVVVQGTESGGECAAEGDYDGGDGDLEDSSLSIHDCVFECADGMLVGLLVLFGRFGMPCPDAAQVWYSERFSGRKWKLKVCGWSM